jgi:3-deoxy-D-manno-octulosonic-acid transferase
MILYLYGKAMQIAALKNPKAKLWVVGRQNAFQYLEENVSKSDDIIWIHTPSLGEFEQARPLIQILKKEYLQYKILITFYSPSGYEVRKNYPLADYVCYLPLDTKVNAQRFVKLIKPVYTFFVKYDFWPNYLKALQNLNHKHYVISAIFRNNHYFFKNTGVWMLNIISNFDHLFVQNEDSKYMLLTRNITQVSNVGDTRFDRVLEITNNVNELPVLDHFKGDNPLFICGSTWNQGEDMMVEFIKHYGARFKYVIAPHEMRPSALDKLESSIELEVLRYSNANVQNAETAHVLIIDNIGLLSSLYAYADIAYIGGGFGKGIHNILEAATFGMPIFIGPNNQKFQEAVDLKNIGVAIEIKSAQEMIAQCDLLLTRPNRWNELKEKSAQYVREKAGATKKIVRKVFK